MYTFCASLSPVVLKIHSPLIANRGNGDFLDMNMLMIDLFGQVLTPAFVGAALVGAVIDQVARTSAEKFGAINWSTFFCIIQIAMLVAGMFITPVSESRSDR